MLNRSINLFIVLFVLLVIGLETNVYWHYRLQPWQPSTSLGRMAFYYSFFTVLSNLLLALGCAILVFKPKCEHYLFNVIRLAGLVGIIITALVYNLMLRGIHKVPNETLRFANESLHVVIPMLGMISWLIWGPFRRINLKVIVGAFGLLLLYGIYIFTRGYYTGLYPYPFINVARIGYLKTFYAAGAIAVLFVLLSLILWATERIRR